MTYFLHSVFRRKHTIFPFVLKGWQRVQKPYFILSINVTSVFQVSSHFPLPSELWPWGMGIQWGEEIQSGSRFQTALKYWLPGIYFQKLLIRKMSLKITEDTTSSSTLLYFVWEKGNKGMPGSTTLGDTSTSKIMQMAVHCLYCYSEQPWERVGDGLGWNNLTPN